MAAGVECKQKKGAPPNLIVVILPEGGNDIYTAVKQCVNPCFLLRSEFISYAFDIVLVM